MSALVLHPSLSEDGWVTASNKVGDRLFANFFCSDYSQTYLYLGEVSSLAYLIQHHQGDMVGLLTATRNTLTKYFTRHFNNVVVEVTDSTTVEDPSRAAISIYVKYTDTEGLEFVLGRLVEYADTVIKKIITINNG